MLPSLKNPNPNENCLTGMKCPECDSYGPFRISSNCWAEVHDDGIEETYDHEWHDDSSCVCAGCHHAGRVKDFKE